MKKPSDEEEEDQGAALEDHSPQGTPGENPRAASKAR